MLETEHKAARSARQEAYKLRSRTRWLTQSSRERGCGMLCVEHTDCHPSVKVTRDSKTGRRCARWQGLMTCGHVWTCPVCSQNIKSKRAERIAAAVRGLGGRWQMVTITLRHREGMQLGPLLKGMALAWRKARQGGRIQRVWTERVTASVRATEVTHGENGWHPHLHVLLRTSEWDDDEKDALLARWQAAIRAALGDACTPSDLRAIEWSSPLDAGDPESRALYLAKLGLEIAGVAKQARSRTPWDVARDACDGDQPSMRLWSEFQTATKGRRMLELDDRASEAAAAQLIEEAPPIPLDAGGDATVIEVQRDDVRVLRSWELGGARDIFARVLVAAEGDHPKRDVLAILALARERFTARRARDGTVAHAC